MFRSNQLPTHVAIIMDGNGRWARARDKPRLFGHKAGLETLMKIIKVSAELAIPYLTAYGFSSENWRRPSDEVNGLFKLAQSFIKSHLKTLINHDVRVRVIGLRQNLSSEILETVAQAEELTQYCQTTTLMIAFNYGARAELVEAVRKIAVKITTQTIAPDDITQDTIAKELFTANTPDPDLMIRTGGESRLSNFLLWQAAYSELYFSPLMWPEFTKAHFLAALDEYRKRNRRFGQL